MMPKIQNLRIIKILQMHSLLGNITAILILSKRQAQNSRSTVKLSSVQSIHNKLISQHEELVAREHIRENL
jgi:hypothetical protein